jgi:hypothetical protein
MEILANGGVAMEDSQLPPDDMLHGGDHHDDTSKLYRQNFCRSGILTGTAVPRDRLLEIIRSNDFKRPTPIRLFHEQLNLFPKSVGLVL